MGNCEDCIREYDCKKMEEGENDKGDTQEQGLYGEAGIC